jgi:EAL domain-containing protein (putative c-di-GMP-specific phosphodiesterase class I)
MAAFIPARFMPRAPRQTPDMRDRFVGFAFAAADMLVEIGADRRMAFTAGAFRERFGEDAEHFTGRDFQALIAPEDHGALEIALSMLAMRGRLTRVSLRLNNAERTQVSLSGLRLPQASGVSWLTIARMPAPLLGDGTALAGGTVFREALEARLRAAEPCDVGLLEVGDWTHLPAAARRGLQADIAQVLRAAGGAGALAGEMADGRFGVLSQAPIDMPELQDRISRILQVAGAGRPVAGTRVPVTLAGVGAPAAMRAMRFALACFAARGVEGVRAAGFDNGLRRFLDGAEKRAGSVRLAIERGRFRILYQPVVHLGDRKLHHYEALLRPFPIPGHETDSTQEFVSFAEAMGLAETLDRAVLSRVMDALPSARTRVAVNVSGLSMQSASFRNNLLEQIRRRPAHCERLMVELTETADIDDVPGAADTVNRLVAAGVPVCLDDFGAGFAAFRYLKEFKVDFVKIDGSYVRNAGGNGRESGFVGAMVELARCVGASAIAGMIETEEQARAMEGLGVQFGQGWLFGKPAGLPGAL